MTLFETTTLAEAGLGPQAPLADTVAGRAGLLEQTQAAEEAVLRPKETGRWPHALRAALAARVARLHGAASLADRYLAAAAEHAPLADLAQDGEAQGLAPVLAFMDKVAARPRDVTAADVVALQGAGVADADIVRLAELNAFLAYQMRVIAGLRLLRAGP